MKNNLKVLRILLIVILFTFVNYLFAQQKDGFCLLANRTNDFTHHCETSEFAVVKKDTVKNYYCEYCGQKYRSVANLTQNWCLRHPNGTNKGKHKLYEGSEKSKYTCKYCGQSYKSISALTLDWCLRHPNGTNKGKHAPAL
jgi:hypothetical protein